MYSVNVDESVTPDLNVLAPSGAESFKAAVSSTFNENPSTLGYDLVQTKRANVGEKLPRDEADLAIKTAGVKLKVPEDGYSKAALDILIKRKQDEAARQNVMDRTPWSWLGTPVRGTAMLLTGLTDPLNIASAFIPVVGEARAASMLAKAGGSAAARAGARAGIGAVEGVVGAAVLEPAVYGLHSQLGDDYSMTDSLINLGFGGLLGAGLHVAGGAGADAFRATDPYARFAGLDAKSVGKVLDYEKAVRAGETPDASGMSESMRRAAGLEPPAARHVVDQVAPETREVALRTAVADMSNGRLPAVDAIVNYDRASQPAEVWYTGSPQEGMSSTRGLAEQSARANADDQFAGPGHYTTTSRDLAGTYGGPNGRLYELPATFRNAFDFNTVDASRKSGETRYQEMVKSLGSKVAANAELQRQGFDAITFTNPRGERIANVFDEHPLVDSGPARERRAAAQELSLVDHAAEVKSTADRQQAPDSVALGSPDASRAAETRVSEAPKEHAVESAQGELDSAMLRLADVQRSLELSGASPAKIAKITEGLKAFDEAIKDADGIGKAMVQNALCGVV